MAHVKVSGLLRSRPTALALLLASLGRQLDYVIFFSVTDEEILARLARRRAVEQRADDDPDAIRNRLRVYRELTAPVLDWYEARGVVHRIPAVGSVEVIAERVRQVVGQ